MEIKLIIMGVALIIIGFLVYCSPFVVLGCLLFGIVEMVYYFSNRKKDLEAAKKNKKHFIILYTVAGSIIAIAILLWVLVTNYLKTAFFYM